MKPVYVMPEFADISLITHGQLNVFTWLKDIRRTDRFMEFDKHDKGPFYQLVKEFVVRGFRKIEHKII